MFRHLGIITTIGFLCSYFHAGKATTCIRTQKQFDAAIVDINKGKEVRLKLRPGEYYLRQSLESSAPVAIVGKNATITCADVYDFNDAYESRSDYYVYKLSNPIGDYPIFYDQRRKIVPLSESVIEETGVNYLEGNIVSNGDNVIGAELKIPIPANLSHLKNKTFSCAFGYFDSGWGVVDISIASSDNMYFYCTTKNRCATNNFMYDKAVYNKPVRFVIYNAEQKAHHIYYDANYLYIPKDYKRIYCIDEGRLNDNKVKLSFNSDVVLDGVSFVGINNITINSKINNVCEIRNCRFEKVAGSAIILKKDNGVNATKSVITDCDFYECGLHKGAFTQLLSSFVGKPCIEVRNCTMTRYPMGWSYYKNTGGGIWVDGDVNLYHNTIYNSSRDLIFLHAGKIVASGNVLYNTDEFNSHEDRNLSNDWGLIYCGFIFSNTEDAIKNKNHVIILENNLLYGAYAYGGDARGIFIDDGRGDVICKNNLILNSQLYSIDARNSRINNVASIRNRYEDNIVTNNYRLVSGISVMEDNSPVVNSNMVLSKVDNEVSNVHVLNDDIFLNINTEMSCTEKNIIVSTDLYNILSQSAAWRDVKKYVRRK